MLPKPTRGSLLNKSHPLARGLVGYWLLNEGSGNKVFDLSGNAINGNYIGSIVWTGGKFGSVIDIQANTSEFIDLGTNSKLDIFGPNQDFSIIAVVNLDNYGLFGSFFSSGSAAANGIVFGHRHTTGYPNFSSVNNTVAEITSTAIGTGQCKQVALTADRDGDLIFYINESIIHTADISGTAAENWNRVDDTYKLFTDRSKNNPIDGRASHLYLYNRALSASEIALLYREPFCMFDRVWRPLKTGGQIVELAGTAAGTSDVTAVLGLRRGLTASTGGFTAVNGSLGIMGESPPEMESTVRHPVESWLSEALFNGMTANAFKLGTSLSLGWFWVRVTGCSVLYRGGPNSGMGEIDFTNILAVSGQDEYGGGEISPPSYIPHNNDSTYFYVVRRFNNCGYQERTLAAAVKVSIKSNGELAEPQPNNISSSKVEQVASNKVRLTWFYCPLEQKSQPVSFNVYYDDRTGQIDYQNPLATIGYKGRKFYSFQSSALEAGEEAGGYLFAIRAEDAGGIENISLARLKIQLDTLNPDAIDILRAEAV